MTCLYCGSRRVFEPVNVCICGRSGSWASEYEPELLPCRFRTDRPAWLLLLRQIRYTLFPVNGPIITAAIVKAICKRSANLVL